MISSSTLSPDCRCSYILDTPTHPPILTLSRKQKLLDSRKWTCGDFFSIRKNGVTQNVRRPQVPALRRPAPAEPTPRPCEALTWLSLGLLSLRSGAGAEQFGCECLEAGRAQNCTVRKSNSETHYGPCFIWSVRSTTLPKTFAKVERRQVPCLSCQRVYWGQRQHHTRKEACGPSGSHRYLLACSVLSKERFWNTVGRPSILKEALQWGLRIQWSMSMELHVKHYVSL